MDAVEKEIVGAVVESLGGEEKPLYEEEGKNPLQSQKEGPADRDIYAEGNDNSECIHDNAPMELDVAQPLSTEAASDDGHMHIDTLQPVCAGKASNEADPIDKDKAIFAHTGNDSKEATVGPRCFTSATDMLDFFYRLLHGWPLNLNINKYEHMMLEDLLNKGHHEWREKVGTGIKAFQVRINQEFSSRCFCAIRKDGSTKDFSYRKCVDNLLPLPKHLKPHLSTSNQKEKGSESQLNTKVSEAQDPKTQRNCKGRGRMDRGGNGKCNNHGHLFVKAGGTRRDNCVRQGKK